MNAVPPLIIDMHFLLSCLLGMGMAAAALLSVQNAAAVSIRFFMWQSVPLPLGMILVLAISAGLLLVALMRPTGWAVIAPNAELEMDEFESEDWD